MPFTFAHPAIVLPFKYVPAKWYSWTGLIIGSMVPDFQAFVNLGGDKILSHSWKGMWSYDLPLALILIIIYHILVRHAIVANLPLFLKKRFAVYSHINWRRHFSQRYAVIVMSTLIGIITHLLLDRITHTDTYSYTQMAGIDLSGEQSYRLRILLQWGGSLLGLILIAWQLFILPEYKKALPSHMWLYWPLVITIAVFVYCLRLQFPNDIDDMINTAIGGFMLGIIVASVCYNLKYFKSPITKYT